MFLTIGHRGAMGHSPENTMSSFEKALELGVDMIECDVTLCNSGEILVFHDDRLERTTNGTGYIAEKDYDELKLLNAGYGESIPTLNMLLDFVDQRVPVNIELKNSKVVKPVADLITNYRETKNWTFDDIIISSFDHVALKTIKGLIPEIKIAVLIGIIPLDYAEIGLQLNAYALNPCIDFINKELVDDAHQKGMKVFVWTVNHEEDIKRMKLLGVDGIFTNYPERVSR